jgi:hypothetical protein
MSSQDVRTLGSNYTSLVVTSHKGYIRSLLDNPHHKAELIRMVSSCSPALQFVLFVHPGCL